MDVHTNIPLAKYTTMRLGGSARYMTTATTPEEVASIYAKANEQNISVFVLGGGSNVLIGDNGYDGLVLLNRIIGFEVLEDQGSSVLVRVGAGEVLDEVIERLVDMGLSGIESLSGIPGTVGAAPVQNVGAYGQEIADTLVSVHAYDSQVDRFVELGSDQLGFSYRHSVLRGEAYRRYCITSLNLRLYRATPQPPFYAALQAYFDQNSISFFTPAVIRSAVLEIRRDKLPDPAERPNAGSFFKNAIIEDWQFKEMLDKYPDMPSYDMPDGRHKVPTGWMIEQVGLKGEELHGIRVHSKNALVLINESANSFADLEAARHEIIQRVYDTFRVQIEQEPLEI